MSFSAPKLMLLVGWMASNCKVFLQPVPRSLYLVSWGPFRPN